MARAKRTNGRGRSNGRARRTTTTSTEAASLLRTYDEAYLDCRDLQHTWQRPAEYFRANGYVRRRLTCAQCDTVRVDTWETNGLRVGSQYKHPEGYGMPGTGGASKQEVRVEVLRRLRGQIARSESQLTAR
jgi:hypothetical protein